MFLWFLISFYGQYIMYVFESVANTLVGRKRKRDRENYGCYKWYERNIRRKCGENN